jgi:hypothetical protein
VRRLLFVLLFCESAHAASALLETRAEAKLTLPQRGEIRLFDFRPDSVRNWKVTSASLLLFLLSGDVPKTLNISTIAAAWDEAKPEDAAHHMFGKDQTHACAVQPLEQGWVRVTLPPALIELMANAKAYGLAIEQGPRKFNGRSPVLRQPYVLVDGEPR